MDELEKLINNSILCIDAITHNTLTEYIAKSNGDFKKLKSAISLYLAESDEDASENLDFLRHYRKGEELIFAEFLEDLNKKSEVERLCYHLDRAGNKKLNFSNKLDREDALALINMKKILQAQLDYAPLKAKDLKTVETN
jgi:dsDNA-binding SOS-regulon protein